ncbi:putative Dol-P-Glc:Glc(2)Man(9)GlcNAc(2)-PP-Dol alpha-1,2-glucosyltransferase [Topomyia yanbarensis]|uniref:putative Dol-P-Glc:Glc(2)Man(9)GlcNAc(2)-PP-Dol alpha-1,2-glucosyltransferase n=1 Tax=Topomyia yanbarensis TaxID=2498891 RepID=UPI00273C947C|nr:putative Dol-P-Glc:Glc(2)Man(9)GlcNAc(2)-PP-Dol alpha-1,2-glucosyltransferase [Topomyia yanbarensis]
MQIQYYFLAFLAVYSFVTLLLFHYVYQTSQQIVDEEFHLRQGKHFCQGRFHIWDPKITTFPGLYLVSALFLSPFKACSVYALRLTSVVASIVNAYFIFVIRKTVAGKRTDARVLLESVSLATLPPLYFFSHLYYTDVLSVTMVLMMVYFGLKEKHNLAALLAFLAVLMRQTNIVWVVFFLGWQVSDLAMRLCLPNAGHRYKLKDLFDTIRILLTTPRLLYRVLIRSCFFYFGFILNLLAFMVFLYWNGSIVVGDKTAHVAAVHLPQIFYFSLFFATFSSSVIFTMIRRMVRFASKKWYITVIGLALFIWVIQQNTIVHPYLLADNRHYTFYIWNRFFGRWWFARYLPIPFYYGVVVLLGFLLFAQHNGQQPPVGFSILWVVASLGSVALQQLIEVRYFILPFLVLRLIQSNVRPSKKLLAMEVALNIAINGLIFYVFFTKEFYWNDYEEAQRVIW